MEKLKGLYASILTLFGLGTAVEVHESIKEQELTCALPIPAEPAVQACRDKEPASAHVPDEPKVTSTPASTQHSPGT
jgi:hypothetical protein